jgi:hypothetical protein
VAGVREVHRSCGEKSERKRLLETLKCKWGIILKWIVNTMMEGY